MTIEELEQQIKTLQDEVDKLKTEQVKSEIKPWRQKTGEEYYCISYIGDVECGIDNNSDYDDLTFSFGNYYRTKELAEQDKKEIVLRNKVRQLRDVLCEGYEFAPNSHNFLIYFDTQERCFFISNYCWHKQIGTIFFDTEEHAQQACDILNRELKNGNIKI